MTTSFSPANRIGFGDCKQLEADVIDRMNEVRPDWNTPTREGNW